MSNRQAIRNFEVLEGRHMLSVQLVADLNQQGVGSNPTSYVALGEELYFAGASQPDDFGLWKFHPRTEQTHPVLEDVEIRPFDSERPFLVAGGKLFVSTFERARGEPPRFDLWAIDGTSDGTRNVFSGPSFAPLMATDSAFYFSVDNDLWVSDGTESGTVRLLEDGRLRAGPFDLGSHIVFEVEVEQTNRRELRRSDGTLAGTELVAPIRIHAGPTLVADQHLYFLSEDPRTGVELWVTDGTSPGTRIVLDIVVGPESSGIESLHVAPDGGVLFTAVTPELGKELWRTRGTEVSTDLVTDLANGSDSSSPRNLWNHDGLTYFAATTRVTGEETWVTDGTAEGTRLVHDSKSGIPSGGFRGLASLEDQLVYQDADNRIWITDGTSDGSRLMLDFPLRVRTAESVGNRIAIAADDRQGNGFELWVSDGTAAGTWSIDLLPGPSSSSPRHFQVFDQRLYFLADTDGGAERFVSDMTKDGTRQFEKLNPTTESSNPRALGRLPNGTVITLADDGNVGLELWAVDRAGQATLLRDFNRGRRDTFLNREVATLGGRLFFSHRNELWATDGTVDGTQPLGELQVSEDRERFAVVGDNLFFTALQDRAMWLAVTDGTADGTELLQRLGDVGSFEMEPFGGTLAFKADDGEHGGELWITDGSRQGTRLVRDIHEGPLSSQVSDLRVVDEMLYFIARDDELSSFERTLWTSDGTRAGTVQLLDQPTGSLFAGTTQLYFASNDNVHGWELWRTDGTVLGTFMVKDINPSGNSNPDLHAMIEVNGTAYFLANDGFTEEPAYWSTRGTPFDTRLVHELVPDPSQPSRFWDWNGRVLLQNGHRLYESDGTTEGTRELSTSPYTVTDIAELVPTSGGFLASLRTPEVGEELFWLTSSESTHPQVMDFRYELTDTLSFHHVAVTFDTNVAASLTKSDLLITSELTGMPLDLSLSDYRWDPASMTATWSLTEVDFGYGVYHFELGRQGIHDQANSPLDGNGDGVAGDSFRRSVSLALAGDIDLNGTVDFADFLVLSANFGLGDRSWKSGDLTGDGRVNFADFLAISLNYGATAAALAQQQDWL